MENFEKIISQVFSLQKQLTNMTEKNQIKQFSLKQLADIVETFVGSSPILEVHTYKDEVVLSGAFPNVLSPQDISVKLDGNILLRVECRWYKNSESVNQELKPHEFKEKIELPYPINPDTLLVTYQKGILKISAKRAGETNTWVARAQILD
ncbi:MAG: Hsp20/alpha crystallin family protein [Syntrophomonadaceae bacterium]|nr:Hsp20/alpha crystallin family protein [Syntrophomonadaceae bacterium]